MYEFITAPYASRMLHYGPHVGSIGLLALALALIVIGVVLSRPALDFGGAVLMVLAAVAFLTGRR